MKIVLNKCFGGFSVSKKYIEELGMKSCYSYIPRADETLVSLVEKYGSSVGGPCSNLVVVEIPDDFTDYEIVEYDGSESIYYVVDGKIHKK